MLLCNRKLLKQCSYPVKQKNFVGINFVVSVKICNIHGNKFRGFETDCIDRFLKFM